MTSTSKFSDTAVPANDPPAAEQPSAPPLLANLPNRQPPALADSCVLHGHAPLPPQVSVIMRQEALRQIQGHAISNLRTELGGGLLGKAYQHNGTTFVEVVAAIPAVSGDHGPVHFTFGADSWRQMQQDREAHYPQLDIVGWFHTHPGLGVFYSGDDVVVHSAAFTLPWHVGLVVDPIKNHACFFGWANGELVPFSGFYELLNVEEKPVIGWQIVDTEVWEESYDPAIHGPGSQAEAGVYLPRSSQQAIHPTGRAGLIAGGLGILLVFFLIVGWVVPINRQVNQLEQMTLALVDANALNTAVCPNPSLRILSLRDGQSLAVGTAVPILGSADIPTANRYRLEMRQTGATSWQLVQATRRDQTLGELGTWDTTNLIPTQYDLRLTAVDSNNVILQSAPICQITVELTQ